MSLFLRRKMEQFSLPQSVPYEQPPNIFKLKSSCTLTHIQRERGTVTRKRKKEKAVRMCAQRPALSPSPASSLILILILIYDIYESIATVGEIRVWWRADFQSGSRVLKKVF